MQRAERDLDDNRPALTAVWWLPGRRQRTTAGATCADRARAARGVGAVRRKIARATIVIEHCSMGGIGPGRFVRRRRLLLECGHTVERKLSLWVGATTQCLPCDRLREFLR